MLKEDLDFIQSRSWYQTIEFEPGIRSRGCEWCGEPAWENIVKFLPETLEGCRVLDLGCNAGLFCIKAVLMGAKEVIGVDWPGWRPGWDFIEQQNFVKDFFECKHRRRFPIIYVSEKMEGFLERDDLGYFDYVFAIASIYYTENPQAVVDNIALIAENVIIRLRDINIIERFSRLFTYAGYLEKQNIQEKWWEKLDTETDDFYMYLYSKNREVDYYRLILGHKKLTKNDKSLNIWQLMNLVGTEIPIEKYQKKISEQYLTYIPLKNFNHLKEGGLSLTEEQKKFILGRHLPLL